MAYLKQSTGYTLILLLLFAVSCGTSDEIRTIEEGPRTSAERAEAEADTDTAEQFMHLKVGQLEPIDNFDPLFANNISTMRVLTLIYDGLYTLDQNGEVETAIAAEHSVSSDSLTYTVTLRRDLFYHDSGAFLSGIGRRLMAADVKWAFERTARANVPDRAASLLMNIDGFEEYFEDQRTIYDSDRRALQGVSGIEVRNPQTIRFKLIEPDPDFLKKLASPYLLIYPREAIQADGRSLKSNPVGTGAYRFNEQSGNRITLVRDIPDRSDSRLTNPRLNRIDFIYHERESDMFQEFAREEIHWIPEIGPETREIVLDDENRISDVYAGEYEYHSSGTRLVNFYLNDTRRVNMRWLRSRLADLEPDSVTVKDQLTLVTPITQPEGDIGEPNSQYLITFTTDPFARSLLSSVQRLYLEPDSEFRLSDLRAPVSRTAIYTRTTDPFHAGFAATAGRPGCNSILPDLACIMIV